MHEALHTPVELLAFLDQPEQSQAANITNGSAQQNQLLDSHLEHADKMWVNPRYQTAGCMNPEVSVQSGVRCAELAMTNAELAVTKPTCSHQQ